jgi:antitoxin YokJ
MSVDQFLKEARREGWEVFPPEKVTLDLAVLSQAPDDLQLFLGRCGGVRCGGGITVAHRIVAAQEDLLGERHASDRSVDWYVIAEEDEASTAERVVIDLDPQHLGRCYDGFWDIFGVAGSMPVVARSLSELLERLVASGGTPYWSSQDLGLGDAYD